MKPESFKERMEAIRDSKNYDTEIKHILADKLMCDLLRSLGYGAGIEVYESPDWTMWHA